jgi:TRAP-type transport system small permease protein
MKPNWAQRGIELLLAALIGTISVSLVLEVAFRYLLGRSLLWAEEFSRFLFLWTTFIGAAAAIGKGTHFSLRSLVEVLPFTLRRAAGLASAAAVGLFAVLLVSEGWRLARFAAPQMSTVLDISRFWFYLAIPVGGALMLAYLPQAIRQIWRDEKMDAAFSSHGEAAK